MAIEASFPSSHVDVDIGQKFLRLEEYKCIINIHSHCDVITLIFPGLILLMV